MFDHSTLILRL